jgi:Tol biopolymer transport system component
VGQSFSAAKWEQTVPVTPVKGPIGFGVQWLGDDLIFPSNASGSWALERWRAPSRTTERIAPSAGLPQVSRDGSTIVFFDFDANVLWKMDADGRNRTRLGSLSGERLSPDGRQLVAVDAPPDAPATVRVRPIDGAGEARVVTNERVRPGVARVSPDGRWIAYPTVDDQNRPATGVCDLATCASKRTLPMPGPVEWTPDSQALTYFEPRRNSGVFVQPFDGGVPRQLTQFPADGQQIWGLAW